MGKIFTHGKNIFCQQPIKYDEREKVNVHASRTKLVNLITADGFINK